MARKAMPTAIANIMRIRRLAFPGLLLLSGTLLGLAAITLPARLALLPGDGVREAVFAGHASGRQELENLTYTRQQALAWRITGETLSDLALADFERARRGPPDPQFLRKAQDEQEQALQRAPADPYGWTRLVALRLMRDGPSAQAAEAWRLSFSVASYEPRLSLARVTLAMGLDDHLNAEDRARLPSLIRESWKQNSKATAQAAKVYHFTALAEEALREDRDAYRQLQALFWSLP